VGGPSPLRGQRKPMSEADKVPLLGRRSKSPSGTVRTVFAFLVGSSIIKEKIEINNYIFLEDIKHIYK